MDFFQVMTTLGSKDDAAALARTLVEAHAAACVQVVGPIESHFWWEGTLQAQQEWLCIAKTDGVALDRLLQLVNDHHPYDVPEITATPIVRGGQRYLEWIAAEVRAP